MSPPPELYVLSRLSEKVAIRDDVLVRSSQQRCSYLHGLDTHSVWTPGSAWIWQTDRGSAIHNSTYSLSPDGGLSAHMIGIHD